MNIVSITQCMKDAEVLTSVEKLESMRTCLISFEGSGMRVGFPRANIEKLIRISRENESLEELAQNIMEEIGRTKKAYDEKHAKLDYLQEPSLGDKIKIEEHKAYDEKWANIDFLLEFSLAD